MKSKKLLNKRRRVLSQHKTLSICGLIFLITFGTFAQNNAKVILQTGHSTFISGLHLTNDVSKLVSSDMSGSIKVFDVHANKEIFQFKSMIGLTTATAMSHDETQVAFGEGLKCRTINIHNGKETGVYFSNNLSVGIISLSFSPDDQQLSMVTEKGLCLFDVGVSKPKYRLENEADGPIVLSTWLNNGSIILCTEGGKNKFISSKDGKLISEFNTASEVVSIQPYFKDHLIICKDGQCYTLNGDTKQIKSFVDLNRHIRSCKLFNNTHYLGYGRKGMLELVDLRTQEVFDRYYLNEKDSVTAVSVDDANKYISVGTGQGDVFMWDAQQKRIVAGHEYNMYKQALSLSVSPDGRKLLVGGMMLGSKLIDLEGRITMKTVADDFLVISSAFHPEHDNEISFGGNYGAAYFYDLEYEEMFGYSIGERRDGNTVTDVFIDSDASKMISISSVIDFFDYKTDTNFILQRPFPNAGILDEFAVYHEASNRLVIGNSSHGLALYDTKKRKLINPEISEDKRGVSGSFSEDGSVFYAIIGAKITKWETKKWAKTKTVGCINVPMTCTYLPKSKKLIVGYADGRIEYFDENLFSLGIIESHNSRVMRIKELPNTNFFVTMDFNGELKIWSQNDKKWICGIVTGKWQDDMIVYTPDNYYMSSGRSMSFIGFRSGVEIFQPEQFDLVYNRPDIILSRLGFATQDMITAYNHAWKRRLKKMGSQMDTEHAQWHAPSINFIDKEQIPLNSSSETVDIGVTFSDTLFDLKRLDIYLNDVPLKGRDGIDLTGYTDDQMNWDINLTDGTNKIQVSVTNVNGIESVKETTFIYYQPEKVERNLYLLSIGADQYQQSAYDLKYAGKDAKDLQSLFKSDTNFTNVYTKMIIGSEFTKDRLTEVKRFFMNAKRNDIVVCTIAGHGVLDDNLDYYFSTYDMDFANPSKRGVSFTELESVVDGLEAIRKLIIIDACHSGEVDKEDITISIDTSVTKGKVVFRAVGEKLTTHKALGLKSTGELTRELFSDLRKGTGAIIISSAGGVEYAIEGDEWQNGVFTYAMLEGIKEHKADYTGDGRVSVDELLFYTSHRVQTLTQGKQKPDYRTVNKEYDFFIW